MTRRKARYLAKRILNIVGPAADKVVSTFFDDELAMLNALTHLAYSLYGVPKENQNSVLRSALHQINCRLPVGLYLPISKLTDTYHYIINIVAEDAFCLGTKSRVPYMLFAETIKVPGVMFSAMEGKLKEIQAQNRMALRPVYLKQTPSRNAHMPETPAFLAVMSMLKEISNENVVTSILHKALNLSGENKTVPTTPSSPPLDLPTSSCQSPSSATPSEGNLENTSTSQRTMSGIVSRLPGVLRPSSEDSGVIRLHVEDNDENEAPEKEEPTKRIATPHLRNLAEGGKQLLMLISPQEDRTNTSVAERRLRIRPKHTAISMAYRELWQSQKKRIQEMSSFGTIPGWGLAAVIVKSQDDLRQEQLAMQLIKCAAKIFEIKQLPLYLRPYEITPLSASAGVIECVPAH